MSVRPLIDVAAYATRGVITRNDIDELIHYFDGAYVHSPVVVYLISQIHVKVNRCTDQPALVDAAETGGYIRVVIIHLIKQLS